MGNRVALVSVIASSAVAGLSILANVGMFLLTRRQTQKDWLRDRRAETYVDLLALIAGMTTFQQQEVDLDKRLSQIARAQMFSSRKVRDLFDAWLDIPNPLDKAALAVRKQIEDQIRSEIVENPDRRR